MRFNRILVLALVLTVCAVPIAVNAQSTANDVSDVPLAQSGTTTTDTMGDGMDDNMTTTDTMGDDMGDDDMTTRDEMTDDQMTDTTTGDQMTDDQMTDDTANNGESGNSDTSLPGFGIGIALVALVGGALYLARTR